MSTRCNVVVVVGCTRLYLYRHHDGYLAEAGADLALALSAVVGTKIVGNLLSPTGMADKFVRSLLGAYYEKRDYQPEARAIWDVTSELHGDIDRCYWITFGHGASEKVTVSYAERPSTGLGESWLKRRLVFDELAEFVAAVNKDRCDINQRVRQANEGRSASHRYEELPLIKVPA